jgi:hypothetical protein
MGAARVALGGRTYLLLRAELRLAPDLLPDDAEARLLEDLLLDDEALGPLFALARSLWALLSCVLALPPLLAAWARLILPEEDEDEEADGFEEDDEEEEELRDAMACSLG